MRGCWRTLREGTTDQRRKYCWHFAEKAMPTPLKTLFLQIKLCCAAEIGEAMTEPMRMLVTLDTGSGQQRSVMLPDPRTGEMHAPWPPCQLACRHTPPCITMHPAPSTRHVHTHPAHYMHTHSQWAVPPTTPHHTHLHLTHHAHLPLPMPPATTWVTRQAACLHAGRRWQYRLRAAAVQVHLLVMGGTRHAGGRWEGWWHPLHPSGVG